jgi:hypothetical protein
VVETGEPLVLDAFAFKPESTDDLGRVRRVGDAEVLA